MNTKSITGQIGESLACEYLEKKGYQIIKRNYRQKWDEVDIIACLPANTLVFVEVKTVRVFTGKQHGNEATVAVSPEEHVSVAKYNKLKRMAQFCSGSKPFQKYINDEHGWRIDLIAVELPEEGNPIIRHYENI